MRKWVLLMVCTAVVAGLSGCVTCPRGGSGGLYPIIEAQKYGFVDASGEVVVKPEFDKAWPFTEGVAVVQVGDKFGFIDAAGDYVIEPRYEWAWSFSEGLACVKIEDDCGYVDRSGKLVIPANFHWGWSFAEGLACVVNG